MRIRAVSLSIHHVVCVPAIKKFRRRRTDCQDLRQYETKDAITPDGTAVRLFVNTGLMIDVVRGVQRGAKGVGLYRSEIPFMLRDRFGRRGTTCHLPAATESLCQ